MVAPFTTRNLSQRSMADVIFDISDLSMLYPNTPKEAFRKFCTSSSTQGATAANGYVRHTLVTHVEGYVLFFIKIWKKFASLPFYSYSRHWTKSKKTTKFGAGAICKIEL